MIGWFEYLKMANNGAQKNKRHTGGMETGVGLSATPTQVGSSESKKSGSSA
jgi:hypothetical protein